MQLLLECINLSLQNILRIKEYHNEQYYRYLTLNSSKFIQVEKEKHAMPGMSCPDVGIEDLTGMLYEVTRLQMVSEQATTSDSTGATENLTSDHQTTKSAFQVR